MMFRNWLFDCGCLPTSYPEVKLISVGNLSYGGTGKTPHIEYLIKLLQPHYLVATLSRGYRRTTKGFVLATKRSAYRYIGDEPLQFARKFDDIKVAVDENRIHGVKELLIRFLNLDVVLLDDAFQHRSITPGLSILLTDFHSLYPHDFVLPSGTLREFAYGAKRADVIVITKTPKVFSPITRRRIIGEIKPLSHQQVFFSYITYGNPVPVTPLAKAQPLFTFSVIFLFTGIANDYPLREHLGRHCREIEVIKFPDHHPYCLEDLQKIKARFDDIPIRKKALVTTEKDFMRLCTPDLYSFIKHLPLYYIPIEVEFHESDKEPFEKIITAYMKGNSVSGLKK